MKRRLLPLIGLCFAAVTTASLFTACAQSAPAPTAAAPAAPAAATAAPAAPAAATAAPSAPAATAVAPAPAKLEPMLTLALADIGTGVLDPSLAGGSYITLLPIYDYLVGASVDGKLVKDYGIAQDWKSANNYTEWTFNLRKGVKFHDGVEVTADDVKFSIEYFMRPKAVSTQAATIRATVAKVDVIDPYTVKVTTKAPTGILNYNFSPILGSEGVVLPKRYIETKGEDYFNQHPIGTGPYKLKDVQPGNQMTFMVDGFQHWRLQPKYEQVVYKKVPEEGTRVAMLKGGEADIIDVSRERASSLQKEGVKLSNKENSTQTYLWPANTFQQDTYFNDLRVRQALALSVDRQKLLNTIFGGMGKLNESLYTHASLGYKPLPAVPYDVVKAKSLLEEAMKEKGWKEVAIEYASVPRADVPEIQTMNEAIVGMWKAAFGNLIRVNMTPMDWATRRARLTAKDSPNTLHGHSFSNSSLNIVGHQSVVLSTGPQSTVKDSRMDELLAAERNAITLEDLATAEWNAAKYVQDQMYIVPMMDLDARWAVSGKVSRWQHSMFSNNADYVDAMLAKDMYAPR